MFAESDEIHARNSGHESLLYQFPTKTSTGRLYIKKIYARIFTKTPECMIKNNLLAHIVFSFSKYVKNHYIPYYNENCLIENCYIGQN